MKPTVSIVTISYNAAAVIEETIRSVLAQSYSDMEYIFVDGSSKDGTVDIIKAYRARLEANGVSCRVVSEPDKGIYDAMNKGVDMASGTWTLMLNAGDRLADEQVLEDLFAGKFYEESVIYGDTYIKADHQGMEYRRFCPAMPADQIKYGMPFCHQSVFVNTQVLKQHKFDAAWRMAADYAQFAALYSQGYAFRHISRVVSIYDYGGVSIQNAAKTIYETERIKASFGWQQIGKAGLLLRKLKMKTRVLITERFPRLYFSEKRGWSPVNDR